MTLKKFAHVRDFIITLQTKGRVHFTTTEAQSALGSSLPATRKALRNLKSKGEIASPFQGFYVVVPPEYRRIGCLPGEEFIPQLMEYLGEPYYAGLLTAAEYHGAAHQRPQWFQVMVEKNRPDIICGRVQIKFIARKDLKKIPTQTRNTRRGTIFYSTSEATALDLIGYPRQAGGISNVATVLEDLWEEMNPKTLLSIVSLFPIAWVQRLGFVLDKIDKPKLANALKKYVAQHARFFVPLSPHANKNGAERDIVWKLLINNEVEPD